MPDPVTAIVGSAVGGVVSNIIGSNAQEDAANHAADAQSQASQTASNAQLEATKAAIASQEKMYNQTRADQAPFRQMGLSTLQTAFGDGNGNFDPNKLNQYSVNAPFSYQNYSYNPLGDIAGQYKTSTNIDMSQDPSYQFRLQQGINALDKSASAKGNLLSGAQQKAINNYAQDYASQEYANAFNRNLQSNAQNFGNALNQNNTQYSQELSAYQQNRDNALQGYNSQVNLGNQKYNQVANLLGMGQTATNQLQGANANYANNVSSAYANQGNQLGNIAMNNANALSNIYAYKGNAQANMWGNMSNAIGGGVNQYMMGKAYGLF